MEVWQFIAIPLVSALTGLITTGIVMTVGGMGVLSNLSRRLHLLEEQIEHTDERITKEVKRRAADAAVEAKRTSPEQQARDHLAKQGTAAVSRPKVVA